MANKLQRGFNQVEKHLKNNKKLIRTIRSCESCMYTAGGFEGCENGHVSEFDITREGPTVYCSYYKPPMEEKEEW